MPRCNQENEELKKKTKKFVNSFTHNQMTVFLYRLETDKEELNKRFN